MKSILMEKHLKFIVNSKRTNLNTTGWYLHHGALFISRRKLTFFSAKKKESTLQIIPEISKKKLTHIFFALRQNFYFQKS